MPVEQIRDPFCSCKTRMSGTITTWPKFVSQLLKLSTQKISTLYQKININIEYNGGYNGHTKRPIIYCCKKPLLFLLKCLMNNFIYEPI